MNKRPLTLLKAIMAAIVMSVILNACKTQTSEVAVLVVQDGSESFSNDPKSGKLAGQICTEIAREIPYGSQMSKIEVTSTKTIPPSWSTMTSRKTALSNCKQTAQEVDLTQNSPGTYACQGGSTALEMLNKTQSSVLLILHIQATELENNSCPDVWQNLGAAITDGQMVMILSNHPLGQRLNQDVYQALKTQENVQFCKTDQAISCVNSALKNLKHPPSHAAQI